MNTINLEDAKVSYQGETLPALELIGRLQTQLREATTGLATVAEALGALRSALLNSHTVEVKLTLSKEDYEKFRTVGGTDDIERIRKAVMTLIHPEKRESVSRVVEPRSAPPVSETAPATPAPSAPEQAQPVPATPVPATPVIEERAPSVSAPIPPPEGEPPASEKDVQVHLVAPEPPKKKLITRCPTCQTLIDVPDSPGDQWPIELKCGNCGSKCLLKPSFRKP